MQTSLSKLATNQFESVTRERFPLMSAILTDVHRRFRVVAQRDARFSPALAEIAAVHGDWKDGISKIHNTEADQLSKTPAMRECLAQLTHKPDMETASPLESWDNTIRGIAPQGSSLYILLLPHGRATLTDGTINRRIDSLRNFATRLSEQTGKPALISLANDQVAPLASKLEALRKEQQEAKAKVRHLRGKQEQLRRHAASEIYAAIAQGMIIYRKTPARVDSLYNVNLLRRNHNSLPLPPEETEWDALSRTLGTREMPYGATHLQAYRQGPGGAPELLAEGNTGERFLTIPSSIIFRPGEIYDLWLVGKNARGKSPPGPVVVWKAPP